jgi:hypothetical protein
VARFTDLPGQKKVEGREYAFQEAHSNRQINLSDYWGGSFIPGRKVDMTMVYKDLTGPKSACPGCGTENNGSIDEEIKWYEFICHTEFLCLIIAFTHSSSCGICFRRIALLKENEDSSDDEAECTHMETNMNSRKRIRASRTDSSRRQKVSVDASGHGNEIRMFRRVHILLKTLTNPKPISDPPGRSFKDIFPPPRPEGENNAASPNVDGPASLFITMVGSVEIRERTPRYPGEPKYKRLDFFETKLIEDQLQTSDGSGKYSQSSKISRGSKKTTKLRTAYSSPTKTSKPDKSRVTNQGSYHSNYHDYQAVFLPNIEPRSIRRTRKLTPEGRAHAALVRKRGACDSCRLGKRKVNLLNL